MILYLYLIVDAYAVNIHSISQQLFLILVLRLTFNL